MVVLNFGHPLTSEHLRAIQRLTGSEANEVRNFPIQIDHGQDLVPQVVRVVDEIGFSPTEWQTTEILVNLPSLNVIAAVLLAELHGRMGYFPPILRLRPVEGALPPRFEVAEIVNLQEVRERARRKRSADPER